VTRNNGGGILQLSEVQLSDGDNTPPSASPMKTVTGRGPGGSWNAMISAGFTGVRALRYAGSLTATGRGYSYNRVLEVDVEVTASSELSYLIFPDEEVGDPGYPSGFTALDLAFDDGTYLSELEATDQHFARLSPQGQGLSRTLYPGEWNYKLARIGDVAAGKKIKRILVGYDNPAGPSAAFGGWIDDIRISATPAQLRPRLLARQQRAGDRGAARVQLLDPGLRRRLGQLALPLPPDERRR